MKKRSVKKAPAPKKLIVALVQPESGNDMKKNIAAAERYVRQAAAKGAELILLPENVALMCGNQKELVANTHEEKNHPGLKAFRQLAKELGVWLVIGSLGVYSPAVRKFYNRSFVLNNKGEVTARYDKIHLFDATLPGGERYGESARYKHGARAVVAHTPWGGIGLSVCYDVRFPHLYRSLAKAGAVMLAVPAAFTHTTGQAHWHILLRARAIENGCFVLAPGMTGQHPGGRKTFGHSLAVDPWGRVLADAKAKKGIVLATLDLNEVGKVRQMLPSLTHDRHFLLPE